MRACPPSGRVRGTGPDGDKFRRGGTQETLGGTGVSEANGVLRNPYHHPAVTIYMKGD